MKTDLQNFSMNSITMPGEREIKQKDTIKGIFRVFCAHTAFGFDSSIHQRRKFLRSYHRQTDRQTSFWLVRPALDSEACRNQDCEGSLLCGDGGRVA